LCGPASQCPSRYNSRFPAARRQRWPAASARLSSVPRVAARHPLFARPTPQ
jgi:hypothetical protein